MTIEEFNNTKFYAGMRFLCKPMNGEWEASAETIISVNFDQKLIATIPDNRLEEDDDDPSSWNWWRCENCELITNP